MTNWTMLRLMMAMTDEFDDSDKVESVEVDDGDS